MKFLNSQEMDKYQDMVHLPHHMSKTHAHMPVQDRAAQFAPFAALSGHYEAVKETARLTEERIEPDESCKEILDRKLKEIVEKLKEEPVITITYFVPDAQKAGGSYVTKIGGAKRIDACERILFLTDGTRIMLDEVIKIDFAKRAYPAGQQDRRCS